jgi:hypothetical protein
MTPGPPAPGAPPPLPSPPCSIHALEPILTPAIRKHPAWRCWLKLVEFYAHVILHEMSEELIQKIDKLQFEYNDLFDKVPEYDGLKRPKHHFLSHIAPDAWRFGPPRGYWCFGFEAFNRVIKAGARMSNKKCTVVSILEYWSMRHARAIVRRSEALSESFYAL